MKPKTRCLTWSLALALILPVASVSTVSAGSAGDRGHSPVYHLDVSYQGKVVGKITVNTANEELPNYVLVAHGLAPNTKYTFGYTVAGEIYVIGSIVSPKAGPLTINGRFPLNDVKELESAHFGIMESPLTSSGRVNDFVLLNYYGWFITRMACYYSVDGGVTWTETGHTGDITRADPPNSKRVALSDMGVPDGALVRMHAIVVGGKDRTGSEIYLCTYLPCGVNFSFRTAVYYITGVTWDPDLYLRGVVDIALPADE